MPQGLLPFSTDDTHIRLLSNRRGPDSGLRNSRTARNLLLMVLGVCSVLYFTFFIILSSDDVYIDNQYANSVDQELVKKRVDFSETMIDRMCSHLTSRCYSVHDKRISTDPEVVERQLIVDGLQDDIDSAVRLIAPNGESFVSSDTRIWGINHRHLSSQYIACMIVAPFVFSSLSLTEKTGGQVLEIGLGGGSIESFLRDVTPELNVVDIELDPVVTLLAEKWFGSRNGPNHKIVVADGIQYLAQAAEEGKKFDVVFLDACDTDKVLPCPSSGFRSEMVVQTIKNVLTHRGIVVVNFLNLVEEEDGFNKHFYEGVLSFTTVFPSCMQVRLSDEINIILVCLPYEIGDAVQQTRFYSSRLRSVVHDLNLEYVLHDIRITA